MELSDVLRRRELTQLDAHCTDANRRHRGWHLNDGLRRQLDESDRLEHRAVVRQLLEPALKRADWEVALPRERRLREARCPVLCDSSLPVCSSSTLVSLVCHCTSLMEAPVDHQRAPRSTTRSAGRIHRVHSDQQPGRTEVLSWTGTERAQPDSARLISGKPGAVHHSLIEVD